MRPDNILFVEVPEFSKEHHTSANGEMLCYWHNDGYYIYDELPMSETRWQILSLPGEHTEEIAKGIVQTVSFGNYWRYENYQCGSIREHTQYSSGFTTALESLNSLILSEGMNPDRVVILKKE